MNYRRQHNLLVKIARIFNTFGPRMQPGDACVVANFIMQALTDRPLTIYGDDTQTRSFCYMDDLMVGLERLMGSSDDFCGPVNLENPLEHTMLELAERIIVLSHSRSMSVFKPLPGDDSQRRCPHIAMAKRVLQWEPLVSLDEGLMRIIDYFRALLNALHDAGVFLEEEMTVPPYALRYRQEHSLHYLGKPEGADGKRDMNLFRSS